MRDQTHQKNADRIFARRLREIRRDREESALANAENLTPNFDRIRKQKALLQQTRNKSRPSTATARLFGEVPPKRPPKPVPTLHRAVGTFTSFRRRSKNGDAVGLGSPPRPLSSSAPGRDSLRYAESTQMKTKTSTGSGWQDPRKATSTYRLFKGFEYSQEIPLARTLTKEELQAKQVHDGLRKAVYWCGRPSSPVTRQLMKDSEGAEHIVQPRVSHVSGYQSQYCSVAKLRPESAWSCNRSSACRHVAAPGEGAPSTPGPTPSSETASAVGGDQREIPAIIAVPCSQVGFIKTIELPPHVLAEQRAHQELVEAEKEFHRLKKALTAHKTAKPEPIPRESASGGQFQTSLRGSGGPLAKMYTIGTSRCCATFGDCDPTRCVHIVTNDDGDDLIDDEHTLLHTITIYYNDSKGNPKVHRETHRHNEREQQHHRACIHMHL